MTFPVTTPQDEALAEAVRKDYFWHNIQWQNIRFAVDVGAHIGSWSWYAKQHAPHMKIVAIEPHTDNYQQLVMANIRDVVAIRAWVGYALDAQGLYCRAGMTGSHYVLTPDMPRYDGGHLIELPPCLSLEDITATHGDIDLLKLDCEGSEYDILSNCSDDVLQRLHVIVGEYHLEYGDFATIEERLHQWFDIARVPERTPATRGHFLAKRKTI